MAIDFQQIYTKIKEIGQGARERRERIENLRNHARKLLGENANELDYLRGIVDRVKETDPNIRCALPLNESLASHVPALASVIDATLIAADGSQINPDRHASVQLCLINVGAIVMRMQSGQPPEIHTNSELLYGDELETKYGTMTEGMVALKRDLRERSMLDESSKEITGSVVTFTDGPIELWGAKDGEEAESYHESLNNYLSVLSRLQARGVITAGYVDKPAADLVVRLLELVKAQREKEPPASFRDYRPLRGVSDRWLYGEKSNPLLGPGERSAVFAIQSKSEKYYQGMLGLHFFYLNVGTQGHPYPVRVEIPKWVADDPEKLNLLHAVLVDQCRMMGSKPYPYLLHRAHEVAVVKQEEKYQVEQMLTQELRRQDEEMDDGSYKQSAKDLKGRTRR
ncbi:MAG: DNA double-strand break repair nuclease NurA [Anaerolineales bacterium]|nr:DNA double-strand break repair nuclease NurA [Anaerolineales bacterium]